MAFKKTLWEVADADMRERMLDPNRSRGGKLYSDALSLWAHACEYFRWCDENPIKEETTIPYQGQGNSHYVSHPRAYTKQGLSAFLGFGWGCLDGWKEDENLREAVEMIEQVIYTQKFEYAAVGMMNASIISRDLGLADKSELSAPNGKPLEVGFVINPVAKGTFIGEDEAEPKVVQQQEDEEQE